MPTAPGAHERLDPPPPGASSRDRGGVLGSGLGAGWLGAVLTVSIAAFLFWGGPLWRATPDASQLGRIGGSYLLVVPLVAGALAWTRRWSGVRMVSSLALVWSAKLLVTATLYLVLAPSPGNDYAPRAVAPRASVAVAPRGYRPAAAAPTASLGGVVLDGERPLEGAVVLLEDPPPGRPVEPGRASTIVLGGAEGPTTLVASTSDRLSARNAGAELHTLELVRSGGEGSARGAMVANVPLPPGAAAAELAPLEPGIYAWSCAVHGDVGGTLVVVDHPYATRTGPDGRFAMPGVPAGALHLVVVRHGRAPSRVAVEVDGATETTVQMKGNR